MGEQPIDLPLDHVGRVDVVGVKHTDDVPTRELNAVVGVAVDSARPLLAMDEDAIPV